MFAGASLAEEPPQASEWVKSLSGSVASWGVSSIRMPPGRGSDPCRLCSYFRWHHDAGARHRRALWPHRHDRRTQPSCQTGLRCAL